MGSLIKGWLVLAIKIAGKEYFVVENRRSTRKSRKPWGAILMFTAPVLVMYLVFIVYPLIATFYYSFHEMMPIGPGQIQYTFVGLENYSALFDDYRFTKFAVPNTLLWGLIGPALEMLTSTTLAIVIYFRVPFHRFYRTAWFMPRLVSGVIVGLVFRWIFNFDWGLFNVTLRTLGLDFLALNWLGRLDTPIWVVIFVHYWASFGYSLILLLAGLTTVSEELIDAAVIDGASKIQIAFRILLPLLRPTFVTVLILSFIGKMQAFNVVRALTNGGPMHASETVATYIQKRAFGWGTLDLGYPAAMAVFWFGIILIGVSLINRWLRRRIE
jgi:ABC-type sugar transport system permease subunit